MQLRNGYPVGCFSGKGLTIAKELVCVICSDVARNITACNECDAAFCEACIQRFWMKEEHLRCPSCEVTWAPSEFVDGRVRLGDLVSFIHRDRKCEIILSSQTLCCPSLFCEPVAPRRGPTGLFSDRLHAPSTVTGLPPLTEEEEKDAHPKKRRRKSSNGASKGAAPQSSCTWTGSTADFDHHVLSCHPELASSAVCLAHLLRRMNEASKHDYLTKYFYVHEILKRFGNNDDLQLLSQSVVVSAFAAIVVEPFYEQERLRAITQGREVYFNRDTAERALVLDSFKGDFQAADCARPDPVAVVSHEFQVKHCVALLVLPYLCDTGLLQRRDVVRMDQRFTGWIYGTWSQRAAGASVEQQLALFEFALPQVSNHMLSQSGGCLLAMVSHVSFLNRVLLALLALPDEALDAPDVADRVTLLFSKCLLRLTYAMRLLGAWPDAIDRAAYARFVLQTLAIPFTNFGRIPAASRGFKLLELGVIPLLTANHRGFFHEAMLHGGAVRFINNQMTWILNRIVHAQQCAVETENRRRAAAAAAAVATRTQRRRGRHSRAQATDAAADVAGDVSAEEAAALARRELCAVLERDTLTLLENAFWVVARLLATPRMRSAREHTLSVQLIDSEIEDGLARLFRDEEAAELQAVALTLWLQTHRVADFRTLNSLLVRVMFGLVTAAGDLHSPLRCGALFAADGVADVRRLLRDDPAALELHEPERLLYQNLQRRGATSLAFRVDGDVADLVSARSALENLAALRDWWTRWLATRATGAEVSAAAAAAAPWATVDVEAGAVTRSLEAIAQMGAMDLEVTAEHQLITVPHRDGDGGGGADVVGGDEVGATLAMLRSVGASAVAPPDALPPASLFAASPCGGAEPSAARGDARKRRRSGGRAAAASADAAHSTAAAARGTDIAAALAAAQQPPDDAAAGDERTAVLRYRFACEAAVFAKAAEGVDHVVLWQLFPPHAHFHVTDDRATLSLCAPSHVLPGAAVSAELRALALREWVLAVCLLRGGGGGANRNESHALFADTAALAAHRLVFDEAAADAAVTQLHQAPREPIDPVAFYSAAGDAPVDEASAAPPRHRLLHPTLVCPPSLLDALERRQQAAIAAATAAKVAAAEGGDGDAKTTRTAATRKTAARGRASRGARSEVAPPPVEVGAFDDEGDDSGVVDVRTLLRAERQRRPPTKKKAAATTAATAAAALSASTPPVDRLEELSAVAGLSAAQLALFASALTRDALAADAANCLFFAPAAGGCASLILLTLLSEFVGAVRSLAQRRQDADALDALAEADAALRCAIDASDDAHAASLAGRAAGPAHKSFLPLAG